MEKQKILTATENYKELDQYFEETQCRKVFLVCDSSIGFLHINRYFEELPGRTGMEVVRFSHFQPNPLYESVKEGVALFRREMCDIIVAVGGGSAMDVAKCIKLYSSMDPGRDYLEQEIIPNTIKLLAVPTTAGTGSEATRYAVIYDKGEKQSITDESCIPSVVLMDSSVLQTLPEYQRKSTMMDALSHAVESFWSVNSTEESQAYSREAIGKILANKDPYLANKEEGNIGMLQAAHTAGKAINITQTTAGHAMCYKLTSLYGIAHGHAAALCVASLFPFMIQHTDLCIDPRGESHLKKTFGRIAEAMGYATPEEAAGKFADLLKELNLTAPAAREGDYEILKRSVNPIRLKNHPVRLDEDTIDHLYHQILLHKEEGMQ